MGKNGVDKQFNLNYSKAKESGYLVGVYHYYRPNENSTQQFNHFNSVYSYKKGDLPPVAYFGSNSATYFGVLVPVISV